MRNNSFLAYQMAAADGATHLGLLILVYDSMAASLLKAAAAVRDNNIELRCSKSQHVLLLLAHLENWVQLMDEPDLAASLRQFYAMLRQRILQLQAVPDSGQLEELANLVSHTRAAWQSKEAALSVAFQDGVSGQIPSSRAAGPSSMPSKRVQLNA